MNTEEKILDAAIEIFVKEGFAGARMQQIADKAGINKSLLHYYYRTKDKLFNTVFEVIFSKASSRIFMIFETEEDFFIQLEKFIGNYLKILKQNPIIPLFILSELSKKKNSVVVTIMKNSSVNIDSLAKAIKKEAEKGAIREIDPKILLINILSLCVFPIIARPLLEAVIFEENSSSYNNFINGRKSEVFNIIKKALTN